MLKTAICKLSIKALAAIIVAVVGILMIVEGLRGPKRGHGRGEFPPGDTLRCVIAVDREASPMEYCIGFDYELLRRFCAHCGYKAKIVLGRDFEGGLDSLLAGKADVLADNWSPALAHDPGLLVSPSLADSSCWIVAPNRRAVMDSVLSWQSSFCRSRQYDSLRLLFTPSYNPTRRAATGRKYPSLSPYDSLIAAKATELGWPAARLMALVWSESHFHIEAQSHKGASGLMQMMPRTARRYGVEGSLDPEETLAAGVEYLSHLQKKFSRYASDRDELTRLVLAAYNAGEGRLTSSLLYDASAEEMLTPEDSLEVGNAERKPLSSQTTAYVDYILRVESLFQSISPAGN